MVGKGVNNLPISYEWDTVREVNPYEPTGFTKKTIFDIPKPI